ncbi:MAG: protein jag [Nitriliruptoraceae bacterium]
MSRTAKGRGEDLSTALTAAIAELVDQDPEKVELTLDAPGIDEVSGEVRLELSMAREASTPRGAEAEPAAEAIEEEPSRSEDAQKQPADEDAEEATELTAEDLDEEADAAADFIEGLLDSMDLPGDLRIKLHDDHAELEVIEVGSGALIGRRGQTLEAIQELVRCSLQRQFQRRARVKVDVEGYRARRLEKLLEKAEEAIDAVLDGGEAERLEPMDVFERKAVHQLVAEVEGVTSRSQGREPARRVVIEAA